ncbi:MAG: glycosyltransferase [Terriglobia bacterium]|jgi:glycosyltransferase involved in cell wall biosynthesis
MNYGPFVSVVIPTFNRAQQAQAALTSVLAQTYPSFEAIVVDDGSTDRTGEAIQRLIDQQSGNGKPIRYFFQPNLGQSAARNKGINEARGEWVAFLDSDDLWFPDKLAWQVRAIDHFGGRCSACITDARLVDNQGKDTTAFRESGKHYEETLGMDLHTSTSLVRCRDPFWVSTLLVRTDVAKQVGSFDEDIGYAEDHDFLFRLSLATTFCYANKPLALLDRSKSPQGSLCRPWDKVEVRLRGSQLMLEKWLKLATKLPPDVRAKLVHDLRHVHSAWTNWYLEHGRYEEAREAASKAIQYQITPKLGIKWVLTRFAPALARRISPKMRVISGQ